ncbi:MAG: bifunctional precorrin-2 dehydrogenase/sirohydrochlorin ferrochelatase [Anaerolineales bacterium]|uniref:precorrin-2 dehydrogenase n=1 Tax=Candidatus Desulfolinea nitratireducens TaxID=2841698 RepID=A0A8J6NRS8_9CHLR|nr:bifunctional precorrin-2 dehydrogenase/sirohydrochlorin ferrochelatase [Candidatus Desulfolinea nitratireducens]MBL6959657.1 bifunctional precorrin-2 dehydrogenase/sirohydrochlorin ferrochelatase [Anaerolineales bacterium]
MKTYTICLIGLDSQQTVVIGGGHVAARKVEGLLVADAQVKVISPVLVPELQSMVDMNTITFIQRSYQNSDLEGAYLAVAATDDLTVNQAIWAEAKQRGCLINVVDDPEHSNFILPAIVQRGEMSIAISTGGGSPALARRMRERLEGIIGPEYGTLVEVLAELRPELLTKHSPGRARLQAALRIIDSEILHIIQIQGKDAALIYAREQLHQQY